MGTAEERHILVIEDSQALREAIRELLAREGFRVAATAGGPDARALLENQAAEVDLIVVNLDLTASSGFDVLEWIRAQRARLTTPILALTGPAKMALTVERLRGLGAVGVQDTRTLWDQLPYRVRALFYPKEGNRRAAVRAASGLPVNCRVGQAWTQGVIGNISCTGMFVRVEPPAEPGQQVLLQFILPEISRLFEVQARVMWASRRDQGAAAPGMGLEFLGLDEAGSNQINTLVRLELEKSSRGPRP